MSVHAIKSVLTLRLREKKILEANETIEQVIAVSPGCTSNAFRCTTSAGMRVFVKTCAPSSTQSMDEALKIEAIGLKAIADTHTIRVPTPYDFGVLESEQCAYLATEYIPMGSKFGRAIDVSTERFGSQLADLHLAKGPDRFGFCVNNTIGTTPQDNTWSSDWVEFLHRRLKYQFELASKYTDVKVAGQRLLNNLETYFEEITEPIRPSLLHGDLWSGNWSVDEKGEPVIYDPAPFWGHSEFDLGIMKLFSDADDGFYKAYHAKIPKAPGYDKRISIYALYHCVNHLNMFGSQYLGRCMSLFRDIF
ncbi:Fructosamine/Ketosamine-3-kinase [Dichotomocladium elegans]|nr:Fructosamine/Ketosamine-3-kinase [Dichotomocladium elegans]